MTPRTIQREIQLPHPPEKVWAALATRAGLAQWMFPNDFEPYVGHRFTFQVPAKPEVNFPGLVVDCEVLECVPPKRLIFSWTAGGPVTNTRVSFHLEPVGEASTQLFFEHSGFDFTQPWAEQAFHGASFGWAEMFEKLASILTPLNPET